MAHHKGSTHTPPRGSTGRHPPASSETGRQVVVVVVDGDGDDDGDDDGDEVFILMAYSGSDGQFHDNPKLTAPILRYVAQKHDRRLCCNAIYVDRSYNVRLQELHLWSHVTAACNNTALSRVYNSLLIIHRSINQSINQPSTCPQVGPQMSEHVHSRR